jgi:hypothetical protein
VVAGAKTNRVSLVAANLNCCGGIKIKRIRVGGAAKAIESYSCCSWRKNHRVVLVAANSNSCGGSKIKRVGVGAATSIES